MIEQIRSRTWRSWNCHPRLPAAWLVGTMAAVGIVVGYHHGGDTPTEATGVVSETAEPEGSAPYIRWFTGDPVQVQVPSPPPDRADGTGNSASSDMAVDVSTPAQLRAALEAAQPGQVIRMADGTYTGGFEVTRSGTASQPITLTGSSEAVLTNSGYALRLRASHWRLVGFTLDDALTGVMLDGAGHNVLDRLTMSNVTTGVHFRAHSSDNTLTRSTVRDAEGRAVSIGSVVSHWDTHTGGDPDRSDANRIIDNIFGPGLRGGIIFVAEGSTGGVIADNTFDGRGIVVDTSDMAWVRIRGNDFEVTGNSGVTSPRHGFSTSIHISGWGCGNVFQGNRAEVKASGYGFRIATATGCTSAVFDDNVALNAGKGLANVPVTAP